MTSATLHDPVTTTEPILVVDDLSVEITSDRGVVHAVDHVRLQIRPGETIGLVGESGSGKSMTGLSVMGLLPQGGRVASGSIRLANRELVGLAESEYRWIRGAEIGMVFQDSMTSLNPTRSIGSQIIEPLHVHERMTRNQARRRAAEMLDLVGIPRPAERMGDYPHQLSGGMRQRVMIAMALTCTPRVLIADEPTTALDVTIQDQILSLLDDLKAQLNMAMLLVTHDMGVVAGRTDRLYVMYGGRIAESADTDTAINRMRHPYTRALLGSIPSLEQDRTSRLYSIPGSPPDLAATQAGCPFAPRCAFATQECVTRRPPLEPVGDGHQVACLHPIDGPLPAAASLPIRSGSDAADGDGDEATAPAHVAPARRANVGPETSPSNRGVENDPTSVAPLLRVKNLVKLFPSGPARLLGGRRGRVHAVSGVSFDVYPGETFGLVGESGSGKTTLGRIAVALESPTSGRVEFGGSDVSSLRQSDLRPLRRDLQMMFQDPYESLDPHLSIGAILREPMRIQGMGSAREQQRRVLELLDEVGLRRDFAERRPHELSGGQRQRVGVARAWAMRPRLIVADEPVSALDASVRSQVLNLMRDLQQQHHLTYIVISHDLTVMRYIADRIGVMYMGKLVEVGTGDDLFKRPVHPYTAGLIAAIPTVSAGRTRGRAAGGSVGGELPSPLNPPTGCRFRTRCPFAQDRCSTEEPALRDFGNGHFAACHVPLRQPGEG